MATQNPSFALKFDVPNAPKEAPPLVVPEAVEQPIASGLATVEKTETAAGREGVICKDMIPANQQAQAKAEAVKLVPAMLDNTQVLMNYGLPSLEGVNKLIDRLMTELPANDTGFIKSAMTDLTLNMKSIKGKYDMSSPDGRKSFDEWENSKLKKFFRRGRNYIQSMVVDMMSTDAKLETIENELRKRQKQMIRNVAYLDALYEENEGATFQLIYAIAVMENVVDVISDHIRALPASSPTSDKKVDELKQRLTDLKLQMDVKVGEYKGRLWVAWATSPQVRMMRVLNVGMAEKINEAIGLTIPTMKLAIVQWRIMAETLEAGKSSQAVSDATNDMIQQVAANSAMAAGEVMRIIQTPTLLPETVTAVTDSLVQMADNILTEVEAGEQRRAELNSTMGKSKQILDGSQAHYSDAVVNGIVGQSRKLLALPAGAIS